MHNLNDMNKKQVEFVIDVYYGLRKMLRGKCSGICPARVSMGLLSKQSTIDIMNIDLCAICRVNFHFISCADAICKCPCMRQANPDEVFLRLDEMLDEYEERHEYLNNQTFFRRIKNRIFGRSK